MLEAWELVGSAQDAALVMFSPSLLVAAARRAQQLFGLEPKLLVRTWSSERPRVEIIDGQFEEIPLNEAGSARL